MHKLNRKHQVDLHIYLYEIVPQHRGIGQRAIFFVQPANQVLAFAYEQTKTPTGRQLATLMSYIIKGK